MAVKKVNVRCCCQPQKILGTLELSENDIERRRFWVVERGETPSIMAASSGTGALKSIDSKHHDRPIEFWRKLSGFMENRSDAVLTTKTDVKHC